MQSFFSVVVGCCVVCWLAPGGAGGLCVSGGLSGSKGPDGRGGIGRSEVRFVKHVLTRDFISEGVAIADVNRDGKPDILAGAYWFEAPNWTRHELAPPKHYDPSTQFSNSFLDFALDVNQDGWPDLVRISLPGEEAVWYENPGAGAGAGGGVGAGARPGVGVNGYWRMHPLLNNAGNESPAMVDVNGDGRKDVVITKGWWECPADATTENWTFHPADLGEDCSQIYALDVKGDGGQELVSASAHRYGIWWHEHTDMGWAHHLIFDKVSETHAMALADVNGDGYPDLVTGKRYYAHNGEDPGAHEPSLLYWFEFKPGAQPEWIPHLIDDDSGVGLQVLVQDLNGDGLKDIIVSNKKGVFFFEAVKDR